MNYVVVAPGSPVNVQAVTVSESSVNVSWQQPLSPNGVITNYSVSWFPSSVNNGASSGSAIISGNSTFSYVASNLVACSSYTFSVTALTLAGSGGASGTVGTTNAISKLTEN